MDDVSQHLADCIVQLIDNGFELPLHVAGIARNGAALVATYSAGDNGLETSFKLLPSGHFATPINLMFVDARGEAARVVFASHGAPLN